MVWAVPLSSTNFIARRLTPGIEVNGIRSLVGFGTANAALALPVLYLRHLIVPRLYLDIFRGEPAITKFD